MNRMCGRIATMGVVAVLGLLCFVPHGRAGGDSPAQDVISAAEVQVDNLTEAFFARTQAGVTRASAALADDDASMGEHLKAMADAVAKIEKDARKTSAKVEKIAERTLARAIALGADQSEVEQAEAIFENAEVVEDTTLEAAEFLMGLVENRYDLVP